VKVLELINRQRQPMARVTWESPDRVEINFLNDTINTSGIADKLSSLLDECKRNGIPLRTGEQIQDEHGNTIFREKRIIVKLDEEQFLPALGDLINRLSFERTQERIFALIQK
jgi:hypothetical protein